MNSLRRYLSLVKRSLFELCRKFILYIKYITHVNKYMSYSSFLEWNKVGKPIPLPHWLKQEIIKRFQNRLNCRHFVETGTYLGDMVEAQRANFEWIYSIELGHDLYLNASHRFSSYSHVKLYFGDSADVLPEIVNQLIDPALFWLDGHYSEGITARGDLICPIYGELTSIFMSRKINHLILIDDERLFDGTDDYPTKDELFRFIRKHNPNCRIEVKYDIISLQLRW